MNSSRKAGTSLVEVLVVIVVLLVGILAVAQIFPGGFRALAMSERDSIATSLARHEMETLKAHADQLPEAILPVSYVYNGTNLTIVADPSHWRGDFGPAYGSMDGNGILYDGASHAIGNWQFLTGPNVIRRVIGEGKIIPTPRVVGSQYGSLLALQFAPLVYNPAYNPTFVVYGNDLARRSGDPVANGFAVSPNEFYISNEDNAGAKLTLPVVPGKLAVYSVNLRAYREIPGNPPSYEERELLNVDVKVDPVNNINPTGQIQIGPLVDSLLGGPGTFISVEADTVEVAREFMPVANSSNFDADPYEYVLLSPQLGLVLFNPAGYNQFIYEPNGERAPFVGRVSYDVYDWRIIHDEFRMPDQYPAVYRLAVGSLKVTGEGGPDGLANAGIGVQCPDSLGNMQNADLVLEDVDSGGLYVYQSGTSDPTQTSFTVDKSTGVLHFLDYDNDPTNGTQLRVLLPGDATPKTVTVNGRSLRALYMAKNEFAVQVLKAATRYTQTMTSPPGASEYYLGTGSDGAVQGRIYFPRADAGAMIDFGSASGQVMAKIQSNNLDTTGAGAGLPYVDPPSGFSGNVKGASVSVRVFWNPDTFDLSGDPQTNMGRLNTWMQGWRATTVQTFLRKGN